ncbi:1,2-phenylacetyl-CoA epoxidase, subunit A [Rubrobacter xylanophilus DSM 9941]|uniref:1,2-phenylacetyl-CoA epoxidase subunit PaaC n=1 Tax=Rubrobacter xylanophilus TaxID=49319 RepID=UPI001C6417CB|nr:Phenylacetic acid catabolic protein [Rubrobacter xylanophilus]QYJ15028.1 1,2-phenylacetyl-CoA epoxidase, subunit A [Rubrobacter xylanophilus DSM 9941]
MNERFEGTEEVAPARSSLGEFSIGDDEALAALVNIIAVLADSEYFLGRRVSEWADAAPLLETSVACAAIAQDKLGHSRALSPLLEELPWPNPPAGLSDETDRRRRYCVRFLDEPFPSWSHVVAALALVSPGVDVVLGALSGSRYEALARRARRILEEERLTATYARGLVRQLCGVGRGRELLQERVDELLPEMLLWFGPEGESGIEALKREGLVSMGNEQMRQEYLSRVVPPLEEAGITVPVRWEEGEKRWEYGELPWERWNRLQRRLEEKGKRTVW